MERVLQPPAALAACTSIGAVGAARGADVDNSAAQALPKRNDCGKCHAVDKKKDGPSFKETAGKLKGKADAEERLYKHLTTSPKIKIDRKEEEHKAVKGSEAETRNLVRRILSR
jgi:cytochrome c